MAKSFEDRWKVWRLTAWAVVAGLIFPVGSNLLALLFPDKTATPGLEGAAAFLLGLGWLFAWLLPVTITLNAVTLVWAHSSVSHPIEDRNMRRRIVFMWAFFICAFILSAGLLIVVVMSLKHA
jgi:hypothetical protein